MTTTTPAALRLVRFRRKHFDLRPWEAFIAGESEQLLVVQSVSGRYDLDGYHCFRKADVPLIEEDFPQRDFIERALHLKQIEPSRSPIAVPETMREMMAALQQAYQLVTIHREALYPDECEIGQVRINSESTYVLRCLNPDATWELDDNTHKYSDVTRLDFGGEYERTLLFMAEDLGGSALT